MKIIEALKNLKTIQKRMEKNCQQIREYCAYVSVETPVFETQEKQRAEVDALIQSNIDLEVEYLRLKKAIETTNLAVTVTIGTLTHTITELISIKRVVGKFRTATYSALTPQLALQRLQQIYNQSKGVDPTNPAKVIVVFEEKMRNQKIREWEDFLAQIDGRLEVVNAETDLQGY
jgi:hypothetical protein